MTVLKEVVDTNKVQFEESDKQPAPFALLFEFEGDIKATRHLMYNCKAARPNIESSTKGQGIEPKTETLNLMCRSMPDPCMEQILLRRKQQLKQRQQLMMVGTKKSI